ncbi:uncharacterized protein BO80DRAFT_134944 [Aspergillus ibericus CBS 121593]|uniref:Uncharacterized protein n=1 Tax=Aspergillus ibericus CBS 121593 TaxID=1448316 RepID=A0A395HGJ5_9EURO|nr:hypothetical protein BO80DRAFT_134944 [Aspergillus ibericus CBS 121593]RAL05344.1 hypothetical protein BO80DRAFT_134944 [Aspergillus ibericus CBS 121593]
MTPIPIPLSTRIRNNINHLLQPPPHHQPLPPTDNKPTHLTKRTIFIPATYNSNGLSPGAVAGVIIGSVLGFIFLLYLIFLALGAGRRFSSEPSTSEAGTATMSEIVVEEEEEHPRRSSRRRRHEVVEEVIESGGSRRDRRSRRGGGGGGRGERIVVEESVTSPDRSDVVEVLEEHSSVEGPERRRRSRPGHYRAVDPLAYGGVTEDESLAS